MTQRITTRKVECGDVGKTVVRSSVRRWKRGKTLTVNFVQKSLIRLQNSFNISIKKEDRSSIHSFLHSHVTFDLAAILWRDPLIIGFLGVRGKPHFLTLPNENGPLGPIINQGNMGIQSKS